jgi:nucleoside-diphosphate-sugar epimerase
VYGDGDQNRSFCYVSDIINVLVTLLESEIKEPVNIGNSDERTTNELAEVVLNMINTTGDITYEERPPQSTQVRCPDIKKPAVNLTGNLLYHSRWDSNGRSHTSKIMANTSASTQ